MASVDLLKTWNTDLPPQYPSFNKDDTYIRILVAYRIIIKYRVFDYEFAGRKDVLMPEDLYIQLANLKPLLSALFQWERALQRNECICISAVLEVR